MLSFYIFFEGSVFFWHVEKLRHFMGECQKKPHNCECYHSKIEKLTHFPQKIYKQQTKLSQFVYFRGNKRKYFSHILCPYSLFIIWKCLVQKDFNIISTSFQNWFVVVFTWKTMYFYFYTILFFCTEMFISSTAIWVICSDNIQMLLELEAN